MSNIAYVVMATIGEYSDREVSAFEVYLNKDVAEKRAQELGDLAANHSYDLQHKTKKWGEPEYHESWEKVQKEYDDLFEKIGAKGYRNYDFYLVEVNIAG